MTKYRQTIFGEPNGNCFATGVASILDLSEIPDLPGGGNWWSKFVRWCRERELEPLWHEDSPEVRKFISEGYKGHYLVSGMGPRGLQHVVVGHEGKFVHDPHPSDKFLVTTTGYLFILQKEEAEVWLAEGSS